MPDWKRVKITFPTEKLGQYIEPVKRTVSETSGKDYHTVYGVTNTEGIAVTGKQASADISNYITVDEGCFAYNPYRINVGSIGFNDSGKKGCVSPAYVVFKTRGDYSPEFLYLYLKSDFGNHLINWYGNRGGVRNALRYDDLCEIDVPKIDYLKQMALLKKVQGITTTVSQFNSEINNQLLLFKKLRQQVLQEAIEGKLTANWRKEHPDLISGENHASKLLEKIKAEKERMINEGKIKKDKPLSSFSDAEKPFDLPEGSVWTRLSELSNFIDYRGKTPSKIKSGIRLITAKNVKMGFLAISPEEFISEEEYRQRMTRGFPVKGDIFITTEAPLGNVCINTLVEKISTGQRIITIQPILINSEYLMYQIMSRSIQNEIIKRKSGVTAQGIKSSRLILLPIAVPPLGEQNIVVGCINKLMTMIEELEKQVIERKSQSEILMQSVLQEAFKFEGIR